MIVLCYDTETTGLPLWKEPSEHPDQPRVLEIAAELFDDDTGETLASLNCIIKPDRWSVPPEITEITGITQGRAEACGVPMVDVLPVFLRMWERCRFRLAHNESFDMRMIRIEILRHPPLAGMPESREALADTWKASVAKCTQTLSTPICNLPPTEKMLAAGRRHAKSPNLGEAYKHFTGQDLEGAHRAAVDVAACKAIYMKILTGDWKAVAA